MNVVNYIGMENMRKDVPQFKAGDTLVLDDTYTISSGAVSGWEG